MAPSSLVFEFALLIAVGVFAWVAPARARRSGRPVWLRLGQLARDPWRAYLTAGITPVVLRLALLPLIPIPVPGIHDEFSYLLLADTLAHGRLVNPPHPHWQHFETFFVLHQPNYASQYPPGAGVVLAFGKIVFGHPWAGVLISVGLLGAAMFWAIRSWLPARWALLGALTAGLRLGVFGYWVNTYWGGALTAASGALVIGGLGRLLRAPTVAAGAAFGAGGGALMLIRPFEGCLLVAACGLVILWKCAGMRRKLWRPAVAAAGLLMVGAALMLGYAYRVTGTPLRLPQSLVLEQYGFNQILPGMRPANTPQHRHQPMQMYYQDFEMENRRRFSHWRSALRWQIHKPYLIARAFAGPLLILPLVIVPLLWSTRLRALLIAAALFMAGCLLHLFYTPHYAAPVTAAFFALVVGAWRLLWLGGLQRPWFAAMAAILPYCLAASAMYTAATATHGQRAFNTWENGIWRGNLARDRVLRALPRGRKHLIFVRYGPKHDCYEEWVNNLSDLDREPVIWARSLSPAEDAELARYYRDRQIWVIEPDRRPIRIQPVSPGGREFSTTDGGHAQAQ